MKNLILNALLHSIIVTVFIVFSLPAQADIFVWIEGIAGESIDPVHAEWIDTLSVTEGLSISVSSSSGTGGRTGGKADFNDVTFVKRLDSSTPDLRISVASAKHIPEVEINVTASCGSNRFTTFSMVMEDVIVSSISMNAPASDERPTENVTLNFGKVTWSYTPCDDKGPGSSIDRTWNVEEDRQE